MKWTRADQVADDAFLQRAVGGLADGAPAADPRAGPEAYFAVLRAGGRPDLAIEFLAQALPRLEVVAWAADSVREVAPPPAGPAAACLLAALAWVRDPDEPRRRAASDAAQACEPTSAAWMAAMAAFYSGGSVAPPDCEPLAAPADAAGQLAAGAILIACAEQDDQDAALEACLAHGERLAVQGLAARGAA